MSQTKDGAPHPPHPQSTLTRSQRCDAGKPACTPCVRSGKGSECEYEETKFQAIVDKLEEENRNLRARVVELEAHGSLPSPQDPSTDVAWLHVVNVLGDIASDVFRFDTVGGQPPTSVSPCPMSVQAVLGASY